MRKKRKKRITAVISLFLAGVLISVLTYSFFHVRGVVVECAESEAATIAFKTANRIINEQMSDSGISYSDIVNLTKNSDNNISALEIDIVKLNRLKTEISSAIANAMTNKDRYAVSVPAGTLFGNEYTLGMGPELKFKMQLTSSVITDFKSNFYSAGINQVLHQIIITVKVEGTLVLPWARGRYSTETTVIAAQTVLVGITPDAYTNVIEAHNDGEGGIVGDIFDYGAGN